MVSISKILVPIDFSDYSKKALNYAIDFAKIFNAKLYLIYVVEPIIYPADFSMGQIVFPETGEDIMNRSKTGLQDLAKSIIPKDIDYEIILKNGKPFIEIIETASEKDIDLIIIATHGHTGVEHLLFGSTAAKVIRKAPCPVLTLRNPIKGFDFHNNKE